MSWQSHAGRERWDYLPQPQRATCSVLGTVLTALPDVESLCQPSEVGPLIVISYWRRNWGSERFSYLLKSHSTKGWRQDFNRTRSELFKALAPLQHCLLSHFAERETEAQEGEAWVVIKSLGSRGQIYPISISPWAHYPLWFSVFTFVKWVVGRNWRKSM